MYARRPKKHALYIRYTYNTNALRRRRRSPLPPIPAPRKRCSAVAVRFSTTIIIDGRRRVSSVLVSSVCGLFALAVAVSTLCDYTMRRVPCASAVPWASACVFFLTCCRRRFPTVSLNRSLVHRHEIVTVLAHVVSVDSPCKHNK